MNDEVRHEGIIDSINGEHITVRIVQTSACLHCKIAGHCNSADSKEKMVDVWTKDADRYQPGQTVTVAIGGRVGLKAVLLAFVVPVVLALIVIVLALRITDTTGACPLEAPMDQAAAAGAGMMTFVIYYIALYFFRDSLQDKFKFRIIN